MKNFIVPFFIPFEGCPYKCIYCDQNAVTNETGFSIDERLSDFFHRKRAVKKNVEVAFFGGTFTQMPQKKQEELLKKIQKYIKSGKVNSIRISTRPDKLSGDQIKLLKKYSVKSIELGVQSFNTKYLKFLRRGYLKSEAVENIKRLKKAGFKVGIQIMMGFPGQSYEEFMNDVYALINLNPFDCRIYPLAVIEKTELDRLHRKNNYEFMDLKTAIGWLSAAAEEIEKRNIEIRRMGLPHSVELENKITGGIYHPSLADRVRFNMLKNNLENISEKAEEVKINPKDLEYAEKIISDKNISIKIKENKEINRGGAKYIS
ncbi:MAG: radical SAM protein [Candidatus Mcinerneyibacterium aminivorans]|uniref:Radical SAM protein n=1 Tax=Candidatus Mcinerneyibacterium aminivorans TaxID=2703815 RepID=A0A5D0MJ52_9BACT|nr:MAG: radical SAM protein [Candidatus Mcinerneyibacterium aminivorans]